MTPAWQRDGTVVRPAGRDYDGSILGRDYDGSIFGRDHDDPIFRRDHDDAIIGGGGDARGIRICDNREVGHVAPRIGVARSSAGSLFEPAGRCAF
jgi:hypothetical protein